MTSTAGLSLWVAHHRTLTAAVWLLLIVGLGALAIFAAGPVMVAGHG